MLFNSEAVPNHGPMHLGMSPTVQRTANTIVTTLSYQIFQVHENRLIEDIRTTFNIRRRLKRQWSSDLPQ